MTPDETPKKRHQTIDKDSTVAQNFVHKTQLRRVDFQ